MDKGFNFLRHSGVQQNIFAMCYLIAVYKRMRVHETSNVMRINQWAILGAMYILRVTGDENFTVKKIQDFLVSPEWLDMNVSKSTVYKTIGDFVTDGLLKKNKHKFELTPKAMQLLNYIDYAKNYVLKKVHERG